MTSSTSPYRLRTSTAAAGLAALACGGILLSTAVAASAAPGGSGDVKIHNSGTAPGDTRDDPRVCVFYLDALNFETLQSVTYSIVPQPTGPGAGAAGSITLVNGTGRTPDLRLSDGRYQLSWTFAGRTGAARQKAFQVDCSTGTPALGDPATDPSTGDSTTTDPLPDSDTASGGHLPEDSSTTGGHLPEGSPASGEHLPEDSSTTGEHLPDSGSTTADHFSNRGPASGPTRDHLTNPGSAIRNHLTDPGSATAEHLPNGGSAAGEGGAAADTSPVRAAFGGMLAFGALLTGGRLLGRRNEGRRDTSIQH